MKFKRTSLILLLIALMPAIFYTAYEFSSLSQSEQVMKNIYVQQMNGILFNINQTTWETTSKWADDIRNYISNNEFYENDSLKKILTQKNAIDCIFTTDSILSNFQYFSANDTGGFLSLKNENFQSILSQKQEDINRMIYRKKIGYDKPVPIILNDYSPERIVILYSYFTIKKSMAVLGICINSKRFMESMPITLDEFPENEIEVGIFDEKSKKIIERTGEITPDNAAALKRVWLFPNYQIGVKVSGVDLNEQVKKRFHSRLKWTILLNSFLMITIFLLLRNIRGEMNLARIKSDFVSNVSHELRTPLALIRMYAETLSLNRVKTEEKKHEYYTVITKESERLSHLVNNILDFSKMESGRKVFNKENIDLNRVVSNVLEMYVFHLEQKGFKYEIQLFDGKLPINGEMQGISEAIINLLDNAMKYSPVNKEIYIKTGLTDNYCWIEVVDHGEGISSSEQARIFEKFYRVSTGLVHNTKGSGLGLSLVDYTMKAHGGNISVKSKLGKGSEFRLNFPQRNEKS